MICPPLCCLTRTAAWHLHTWTHPDTPPELQIRQQATSAEDCLISNQIFACLSLIMFLNFRNINTIIHQIFKKGNGFDIICCILYEIIFFRVCNTPFTKLNSYGPCYFLKFFIYKFYFITLHCSITYFKLIQILFFCCKFNIKFSIYLCMVMFFS